MSIIFFTDGSDATGLAAYDLTSSDVKLLGFDDSLDTIRDDRQELVIIECVKSVDRAVFLLESIKRVRNDLPVIFISRESSEEIVLRVFRAGVREFYRMPVPTAELQATVHSILNLKRQAMEKRRSLQATRSCDPGCVIPYLAGLPANILKAIRLIEARIAFPPSLDELARESCLSRFHFCRLFKSHVGMSPKQYILSEQINHSRALLKNSGLTISVIALRSGFSDLSQFTRQFHKIVGVTPSQFRASLRRNSLNSLQQVMSQL